VIDAQLALSSERWGTIGSLRARKGLHTGVGTLRLTSAAAERGDW
jgi:hypothetical protein